MGRQPQEVDISDLTGGEKHVGFEQIPDADILVPELMFPGLAEPSQNGQDRLDITRPVGVLGMAGNPDDPVFGQRAGRPGFPSPLGEPLVGRIVMDMQGVKKGQEDVDIQQKCNHG